MNSSSKRYRVIGIALIVLAGGVVGVWVTRGRGRPPNVLLISIDTCRPDHLGCYGYPRSTTPNIDRLARKAVRFARVITPVPQTLPAHSSMLTGTVPPYHGVHSNIAYRLRDSNVTVAEVLRDQGYATGAAIGAFVLDRQFGLAQGFDDYDDDMAAPEPQRRNAEILSERPADKINAFALEWVEKNAGRPFFLFLHYYDPHYPYQPPAPFAGRFSDSPYDGEIAYVDQAVGRVLQKLKTLGLYDDTLIIVTGDHGESLGEHGESEHGYFIYHSTTRVPLIIKGPGIGRPIRVDDPVALVDIAPTIYAVTGSPMPPVVHGIDLSRYLTGEDHKSGGRFFFSESLSATPYGCSSLLALETGEWKYIQSTRPELYQLASDPHEQHNVVADHPTVARRYRERLRAWLDEHTRVMDEEARSTMDAEALARLESLGYIGGRVNESFTFDTKGEDPKDFHPLYEKLTLANRLVQSGELDRVRALCREVLAQRDDVGEAYKLLGRAAFEAGRFDEAAEQFERLIQLQPDDAESHNALGNARTRQGRLEEAIAQYRKAIELAGRDGRGEETLDQALVRLGRVNPVLFEARRNLANVLFFMKRYEKAVRVYRRLVAMETLAGNRSTLDATRAEAYYQMGVALTRLDRIKEASEALTHALQLKPDHAKARAALDAVRVIAPASDTP